MRIPLCSSLVLAPALCVQQALCAQQADVIQHPFRHVPAQLDSGYLDNVGPAVRVVYSGRVHVPGALNLRLYFDRTNLPEGTRLRLTSVHDAAIELFDGRSLADYQNYSSWFNGDAVQVELIAAPGSTANRVRVIAADAGEGAIVGPTTICGTFDDRLPSTDPRQGRQYPTGCTSWLIDLHTVVTAGHCTATTAQQIHFNVPLSTSTGAIVLPPPDQQYRYDTTAIQRLDAGVGNDWAVSSTLRNATTGLYAGQRQGAFYQLAAPPAFATGQQIRITGYGTDTDNRERSQTQQTHVGPRVSVTNPTALGYQTDTTGGNSGSPVVHENTGIAIGVHTHGGCTSTGGSNSGTAFNRPDWTNAVNTIRALKRPGGYQIFGTGCGTGTPPRLANNGFPDIGRSMAVEVTGTPQGAPLALYFGSRLATPVSLAFLNMAGCNLYVSITLGIALNADGTGRASLNVSIPNDAGLLSVRFTNQAAVVSFGATPANVVTTNAGEATVGQF
jgi:V8-like Glu-specific endopeptidase